MYQNERERHELGLIELAQTFENASLIYKVMGYSLDIFLPVERAILARWRASPTGNSRKKPCIKNRVEKHVEKAPVEFAIEKPAHGQLRISNELKKNGIFVSPGSIRFIWLRHDLETFRKRHKAL